MLKKYILAVSILALTLPQAAMGIIFGRTPEMGTLQKFASLSKTYASKIAQSRLVTQSIPNIARTGANWTAATLQSRYFWGVMAGLCTIKMLPYLDIDGTGKRLDGYLNAKPTEAEQQAMEQDEKERNAHIAALLAEKDLSIKRFYEIHKEIALMVWNSEGAKHAHKKFKNIELESLRFAGRAWVTTLPGSMLLMYDAKNLLFTPGKRMPIGSLSYAGTVLAYGLYRTMFSGKPTTTVNNVKMGK